jgi:hypothetical protein
MFKEQVFWKDGVDGEFKGGIFIRAFDLVKFLEKVEADSNGGEVVGLKFDGNNLEIIVKSES